ncbi:MAG: EAL domain-containing protein [Bacillota bacterium]|nr:EAL domain-containing protein [Bacillota bacterium]
MINKKWSYDKKREEKIKDSTITYFDKLSDLTNDVIPNIVIGKIEDKFNQGITVVAKITKEDIVIEGIETEGQLAVVKELGCELFQGFYFEKPISKEEFDIKYM